MVDVRSEITIARPIEHVAAFASEPENAPLWYDNIKRAVWKTAKPLSIGSQITFEAHFLGRRLIYLYEVTAYTPAKELIMQTAEGPFPMTTIYTWRKTADNRTIMTLRNVGKPTGFTYWMMPIMKMMMRKANRKDLQKLKEILEANASG